MWYFPLTLKKKPPTTNKHFRLSWKHLSPSYLTVLLQVRPHAGSIATSHQDVVGEVVDTWQWAGELASAGLVVVPHVGHHIIKLKYFTPFVLFAEARVEGNFGAVERGAVATRSRPRGTRWTRLTGLSRRSSWAWRTRKSRASSKAWFPLAVWEVWGLRGHNWQLPLWGGESVTHHFAAS